ncbi:hypothetical protein [Candidatus Solincola tengchongensis]|uniref:hypothetical protein n=1 Tax=Candidatus Solincola tengchongensis TaxID=2900693 RepID=UPI0025798D63|nr:hypothetical protein [Candidatus Solincola tengchongensis]
MMESTEGKRVLFRMPNAGHCVAVLVAALAFVLTVLMPSGCGKAEETREESLARITEAATAFLDALGDLRVEVLREMMTDEYLENNQVPDPITRNDLVAALGYLASYRFSPDRDVVLADGRATVTVALEITGKGEREETLALKFEEGAWKVDAFTALDWSRRHPPSEGEEEKRAEVEQALRDFLIACLDGKTEYIFQHLSRAYKEKHRLEKPWTAAEFSGVFGTARSYDFHPEEIELEDESAQVDVTIEFGTRGNLESETSRVRLVREKGAWLIDAFPFFIY